MSTPASSAATIAKEGRGRGNGYILPDRLNWLSNSRNCLSIAISAHRQRRRYLSEETLR
jgi:hypothetical protein